jgi:sialidase-1
VGGATFAAGLVGQAFSFDGNNSYVSLPDSPAWNFGAGGFTLDFWVRSSNSTSRMHALSFEPSYGTRNLDFDFNDPEPLPEFSGSPSGLWVYWNSTGSNRITVAPRGVYTDGQWHHIALTRSGSTLTLYVDGSVVGTATYSAPIDLSNSAISYIGAA